MKLRRTTASNNTSNSSFRKGAFLCGVAVLVSTGNYQHHLAKLEKEIRDQSAIYDEFTCKSREMSCGIAFIDLPAARLIYDLTIEIGGKKLGDLECEALRRIFTNNHLPFRSPYFDPGGKYALGESLYALSDPKIVADVNRYLKLRRDAESSPILGSKAEADLTFSVCAMSSSLSFDAIERARANEAELPVKSMFLGGAVAFALYCANKSLSYLRNLVRSITEQFNTKRLIPVERPLPSTKTCAAEVFVPLKPSVLLSSTTSSRPRTKTPVNERDSLISDVRDELCGLLDSTIVDPLISNMTISGKLSNKIMRDILAGDYSSLVALLDSLRPFFDKRGILPASELDSILSILRHDEISVSSDPGSPLVSAAKRSSHPIDSVSRWGWKPQAFIRLLETYGFKVGDVTGGGHPIITYNGEVLRYPNGRPVCMKSGTTLEVTPGVAGSILKYCTSVLVAEQQK
ncbi:hypothetical protein HZC07_03950 [Candidatus Micrarchaeota archaeon]|nr:hypothetical protein [Candidatus Micrarchaeota archaeon]